MKQFFKWIGKHIAGALVFSLFSLLFIAGIVYALTYPSAPPAGEVVGGKFMQYFNSIKVACPDGYYLNGYDMNYVKQCKLAPTGPQGPAGANGATGPQGPAGPQGGAGGVSPTGTLCGLTSRIKSGSFYGGYTWVNTNQALCMGSDPYVNCPSGYGKISLIPSNIESYYYS